jgi:F-type H+-transporting ATPase subunit b
VFLAAEGRIFGLDWQLLSGMVFQIIAILLLFILLSFILYEPVRKILNDRKERVAKQVQDAKKDRAEADKYRAEYEAKLKNIDKEADLILGEARKKALARENEIVADAKAEAQRIIAHANQEAELEMKKAQDEIKQQIIEVAALMAGKIVAVSLDEEGQNALIEETLKEMGDNTWLS